MLEEYLYGDLTVVDGKEFYEFIRTAKPHEVKHNCMPSKRKEDDFEEQLRELCSEYDKQYGEYPENRYEGTEVLKFYLDRKNKKEVNK